MSPAEHGSAAAAVADRIRDVRLAIGLTQEDFADLIEVSRSHLASIETHRIEPSLRAILGVLVMDIRVSGEPTRPVDPTWLLLGPDFERDMWGKVRHVMFDGLSMDDRDMIAHKAQFGIGHSPSE